MTYRLALIAHDMKKDLMVSWAKTHLDELKLCSITATGTTGTKIMAACPELDIHLVKSGPLGGDQQIGAMIANGEIDGLVFFVDPLSPHPHDVDVKALTRLALVYDIPMACNKSTADLVVAGYRSFKDV